MVYKTLSITQIVIIIVLLVIISVIYISLLHALTLNGQENKTSLANDEMMLTNNAPDPNFDQKNELNGTDVSSASNDQPMAPPFTETPPVTDIDLSISKDKDISASSYSQDESAPANLINDV